MKKYGKREEEKKTVSFWASKETIEKLDQFLAQFAGVAKQDVLEYMMYNCAEMNPKDFIQSFRAFMTDRITREIKQKGYDSPEVKEMESKVKKSG